MKRTLLLSAILVSTFATTIFGMRGGAGRVGGGPRVHVELTEEGWKIVNPPYGPQPAPQRYEPGRGFGRAPRLGVAAVRGFQPGPAAQQPAQAQPVNPRIQPPAQGFQTAAAAQQPAQGFQGSSGSSTTSSSRASGTR